MQTSDDNGSASTNELKERDQHVLSLLNSMDSYLILINSLSTTLRQGWLELASARHSMGAARVSSTLFDHKTHNASTTLEVDSVDTDAELPHFTLCKWASSNDPELSPNKPESPESPGRSEESGESPVSPDVHAQKARSRSLSMFGKLVSPKLRATQLSFETALEMLVEISNVRSSLLHAHEQVEADLKAAK